jgi:hypothetical protein
MRVSSTLVKKGAAFFPTPGRGLTAAGVAVVVAAAAVLGALFPQAPPGQQWVDWQAVRNVMPVTRWPGRSLFAVLGKELHGAEGSDIGQIAEILVDVWGQPRAVIVNFGGFLGIGGRQVAVDWRALQFYWAGQQPVVETDLAPSQVAQAPQYKPTDQPVTIVAPAKTGYGP